jgi:uncharacterized membrane protein YccC
MLYSLSRMGHAHTAGPSASAALATMLGQRGEARWDWLPRLPCWLDPLSTLIALKTGVGLVIAVTIALWLGWSPTGAAFACLMLQTTYLGRTLGRSVLRMAGALAGSLVAMTMIATLVQERAALIAAYALLTGLVIYLEQESEHPYALLFVLFSVGTITFGTIDEPELAFSKAVSWVSGNALGITIVLIMHGVLWPHTGEKSFEQQMRTFLQGLAHLFALKVAALPHAAAVSGETPKPVEPEQIRQLEAHLIAALAQLRQALGIASRDTPRIARFAQSYDALLDDLQSLTSLIIAYGENLRIWRSTAVAAELVPGSNAARVVMHTLQGQLDDLCDGCDRARDGTGSTQGDEPCQVVEAQLEDSRQRLRASQHTMLEAAAFDSVSEKAVEASRAIAAVRDALATVEHPGRRAARARRSQVDVITRIQSPVLRLQKALAGTVAVVVTSLMWIGLDWPMPSSLMVFVVIPAAFNAMVATFPVKAALKSLFWGPAIATVLYFAIMPQLDGMLQLAPILILVLFPNAYRTNSANPATMLSALFSNLWIISLIDLTQGQVYSFSAFANNAIGIIGGVGVGVATLAFFIPARPEHRFKGLVRTFLLRCEQAIAEMRPHPQDAPGVSPELEARRAEWLELLSLSEMWAGQLDQRRHSQEERARLGAFVDSLWAVAFRLEALEEARQRYPDESLVEKPCAQCRAMAAAGLVALRARLAGPAPAAVPAAAPAIAEAFGAALEPLHEAAHRRDEIVGSLHHALTLTGYYHAVAQAVDECQERAAAIDWQKWDEAYF